MIKQTYLRGLQLVVAAVVLSVAIAAPASAATASSTSANNNSGFSVVVSPPSQGLQTTPGKSVQTKLSLQNQGITDERIKVTVMKFNAADEQGTPNLITPTASDEFVNWISFSETHFDVAPGASHSVTATITPPASAAYGYYYAILFSRDGATTNKGQANLLASIASLVLLDVKAPGAVRKAEISSFSTSNKLQEFLPVNFNVRMYNPGNTHVVTRGNIYIRRGGKTIATLDVNAAKGFMLPKTHRVFNASWSDGTPHYVTSVDANGKPLTDKQGHPITKLKWDGFSLSKLRFGKYTAQLTMVYNDGSFDIPDNAQLTFWVMPWRIIAVALVVLAIFGTGLWFILSAPIRRALGRRRKTYNGQK